MSEVAGLELVMWRLLKSSFEVMSMSILEVQRMMYLSERQKKES